MVGLSNPGLLCSGPGSVDPSASGCVIFFVPRSS